MSGANAHRKRLTSSNLTMVVALLPECPDVVQPQLEFSVAGIGGRGEIQRVARLVVRARNLRGEHTAAGQGVPVENERAVGAEHIPDGAGAVAARGWLLERVMGLGRTVFGLSPGRASAAAGGAEIHRDIEHRAVDPRLAAGHHLLDQGAPVSACRMGLSLPDYHVSTEHHRT